MTARERAVVDRTVERVQGSLARPPAAVGAALERARVAVGVRVACGDAERRKAGRLRLRRTTARPDAVDATQELTRLATLAGVPLKRRRHHRLTSQPPLLIMFIHHTAVAKEEKLETVSIAEPLQNRQHEQNP